MKSVFARSLFKSYDGINAVDGIDLDVDEGQIFGFLGPNGAGKSTVIKLLTTLIQPTSGKISVLEIDAAKEPLNIRKKIGVVLQQPSYEPTLTVEKSLEKYGMMWDIDKKTRMNKTEELLALKCNQIRYFYILLLMRNDQYRIYTPHVIKLNASGREGSRKNTILIQVTVYPNVI